MNLNDTLEYIAADFGLDAKQLQAYAAEDTLTGWDNGEGAFPIGSLFRVEGQTLYALVRYLKPKAVLELGTRFGCSASHIAAALVANGSGKLVCVDIDPEMGSLIPARYLSVITKVIGDVAEYAATCKTTFDIVFEDASHRSELVAAIWRQRNRILNPSGFMISHDAAHYIVGKQVMAGIRENEIEPKVYLTEPSDCGLAISRMNKTIDYENLRYADIKKLVSERGLKTRNTKAAMIEALINSDSE